MEVHHHTHPGTPVHRKKWTHYLWEFLMLFLAVFCGFLAEYQLEHQIEKDRVKKYMHDLVENLKYDTTRISRNVSRNQQTTHDLDSFRYEIREAINGRPRVNRLYYFYLKINQYGIVAFNKSTMMQLKNSGNLRLIKNDSLLNEILEYYERTIVISEFYQQSAQRIFELYGQKANEIFSTTSFDFIEKISESGPQVDVDKSYRNSIEAVLQNNSLKMLTNDTRDLEMIHSEVLQFEWYLINYTRALIIAHEKADHLIKKIGQIY